MYTLGALRVYRYIPRESRPNALRISKSRILDPGPLPCPRAHRGCPKRFSSHFFFLRRVPPLGMGPLRLWPSFIIGFIEFGSTTDIQDYPKFSLALDLQWDFRQVDLDWYSTFQGFDSERRSQRRSKVRISDTTVTCIPLSAVSITSTHNYQCRREYRR